MGWRRPRRGGARRHVGAWWRARAGTAGAERADALEVDGIMGPRTELVTGGAAEPSPDGGSAQGEPSHDGGGVQGRGGA